MSRTIRAAAIGIALVVLMAVGYAARTGALSQDAPTGQAPQQHQTPPPPEPQPQAQKPVAPQQQQQDHTQKPEPAQGSSSAAPTSQKAGTAAQQRISGMKPSPQVGGSRDIQLVVVTSPGALSGAPAAFYGVPVSVHAQVADVYDRHTFSIEADNWGPFGRDVIVTVPAPEAGAQVSSGDFVTVVGTVRPFVRAELERDFDWFDFDGIPDVNIDLKGRPIIVADIARTSDGKVIAKPATEMTRVLLATPGQIAETPGRFYGRTVAVRQEIERIWSPRVFTLDEDNWFAGPDLLVFNPDPVTMYGGHEEYDGERVLVYGTVRPFVSSEFDEDYDWFAAGDYERFGMNDWNQRPVIVASSIVTEGRGELVQFRPDLALDRAETQLAGRAKGWSEAASATTQRSAPGEPARTAHGEDATAKAPAPAGREASEEPGKPQ